MTSPPATAVNLTTTVSLEPRRFYRDYFFDHSQLTQPRGKSYILSVDDEALTLITRQAILEMSGYEVLSAADGREALDIFAAHHVDLAILDFRMPGLDGGSVARELKRLRPLLPIIMVSGEQVDDESKACVDFFLTKGKSPHMLLREIDRLLAPSKIGVRAAPGS